MVLGFVLLALISIAYQIAAKTGQGTAVGLMLLAAPRWPLPGASAMRFRLGATRWKGLRLQFSASWKEVYLASWPVFALALVWFGVFFGVQMLARTGPGPGWPGRQGGAPRSSRSSPPMGALLCLGLLLSILCFHPARIQLQKPAGAARPPGQRARALEARVHRFREGVAGHGGVFIACVLVVWLAVTALAVAPSPCC